MNENTNIIDLKQAKTNLIATGYSGSDENWLKNLPKGTVFVCKKKNQPKEMLALDLYFVIEHQDTVSNLVQKIPTGQQADLFVDSLEFSRYYTYKATVATVGLEFDGLAEAEAKEEPVSETTDDSPRPV
jgi:hypothetical protein